MRLRSISLFGFIFLSAEVLHGAGAGYPTALARYSGGVCELRLTSMSLVRSKESRRAVAVNLEFQLDLSPSANRDGPVPFPPNIYLDNHSNPLIAASVSPGKNLAKDIGAWSVEPRTGKLAITGLEIGRLRSLLQEVEVEVVLTKLVEWEPISFRAGLGRSDFFQCGPFELRTLGEAQRLQVEAWAYPQFKNEQEAYFRRMPLTFLDATYAMEELSVMDAANRVPAAVGTSVPTIGAASRTFGQWRKPDTAGAAVGAATEENIVYPVTITVQMPARFEKERVRFRFNEMALPALAE